jgi:riboflavin kinase/FMN adenylyltransferase
MASVTLEGERVSSTAVRSALAAGDLDRAGRLLGRAYSISWRVMRMDSWWSHIDSGWGVKETR